MWIMSKAKITGPDLARFDASGANSLGTDHPDIVTRAPDSTAHPVWAQGRTAGPGIAQEVGYVSLVPFWGYWGHAFFRSFFLVLYGTKNLVKRVGSPNGNTS